jgi:ribonuclease HI
MKAPPGDWLKVNCDGSFLPGTRQGGWGFVIRDAQGDVMGAAAGRLDDIAGPERAEAEACNHALQFAASWGIQKLLSKLTLPI